MSFDFDTKSQSFSKTKKEKIRFGKEIFRDYADLECDNQLFLKVSEISNPWSNWRKEEKIKQRVRPPIRNKFIINNANEYEQAVYRELMVYGEYFEKITKNKIVFANLTNKNVVKKKIRPHELRHLLESRNLEEICLLEYGIDFPDSFKSKIANLDTGSNYPDIWIIRKLRSLSDGFQYFDSNGNILNQIQTTTKAKYGISIVDIKYVPKDRVSNKYFAEILYYLQIINYWIYENKLNDLVVILINNNGILPSLSDGNPRIQDFDVLRDSLVIVDVLQSRILFDKTISKINQLANLIPLSRLEIPNNFNSKCEKCGYLDDCLANSGYQQAQYDPKSKSMIPAQWSSDVKIDLLPRIKKSSIEQLKINNITTIKSLDLALKNNSIIRSLYPEPIDTDLPLLDIKSDSILQNRPVVADKGKIYSTAIPFFSRTRVTFTVETDPTTDYAFAFGAYLNTGLNTNSKSQYASNFSKWWKIWQEYLDFNTTYNLDSVNDAIDEYEIITNIVIDRTDGIFFAKALHSYKENAVGGDPRKSITILRPGDTDRRGKVTKSTRIELAFVLINLDLTRKAEEMFVFGIIKQIARIIRFCMILERYIREGSSFANTAFFYWSSEIISKLEELFELHYKAIASNMNRFNDLYYISRMISPSNQVADSNQLKRVYDLSNFVETTIGIPTPISYTWQTVAQANITNFKYSRHYWTSLFNNMDRTNWHQFLELKQINQLDANQKYQEIQSQVYSKVRTLEILVNHFQVRDQSRSLISNNYAVKIEPIKTRGTDSLPMAYHILARNWYLFAVLTETIDQLTTTELRSSYPELAVGKLEAAKCSNFNRTIVSSGIPPIYNYTFEIVDRSSFTKLSEGDRVFIFPIQIRDSITAKSQYKWGFEIIKKIWDETIQGYRILTNDTKTDLYQQTDDNNVNNPDWYIYPRSGGYWAFKLYTRKSQHNSLLHRFNLGITWLGYRLALIWNLLPNKQIHNFPINTTFTSAEMYMFGADLLVNYENKMTNPKLRINVEFEPDPSQMEAINFALNGSIRLILGPPGTGKSQTIASLIEEFILREKELGSEKIKILIYGFSYNALSVVGEKLARSKKADGTATDAAKSQKIFLMSKDRDLPSLSNNNIFEIVKLTYRSNGFDFQSSKSSHRITAKGKIKIEELSDDVAIFFSNAHQLYHFGRLHKGDFISSHNLYTFDLIIVDEASQLPTDHMLSAYRHLHPANFDLSFVNPTDQEINASDVQASNIQINTNSQKLTQVVFVGDSNQLPPVQPVDPPNDLEVQLGSVFDYYQKGFMLTAKQLVYNYRSHRRIIEFTNSLNIYNNLSPAPKSINGDRILDGDISLVYNDNLRNILDPKKIVVALIHNRQFDTNMSIFEAKLTVNLVLNYFKMINPTTIEKQLRFWSEDIGIVAPHNAHSKTIINMVFRELVSKSLNMLGSDDLMAALSSTIFSVEKFQGSERKLIIGTIGVSAKDQLRSEEEFIFNRNRINVLTTRAISKMILICSQNYLEYIPSKSELFFDVNIMKRYAYGFCDGKESLRIDEHDIEMRYKNE